MSTIAFDPIYAFLVKVDRMFPTALSAKTGIREYALKLSQNATLCVVEERGEIVSMVAGYTENTVDQMAYISLVATLPGYRRRSYARDLVLEFIRIAGSKRLRAVHLYTAKGNLAAIRLYSGLGFVPWYPEQEQRPGDVHFIYDLTSR